MKAMVRCVDMNSNEVSVYTLENIQSIFYESAEKIVIITNNGNHTYLNNNKNYSVSISIM